MSADWHHPLPPAPPEPAKSADLELLEPAFRPFAYRLIVEAARRGVALFVVEARRSAQRQDWLYGCGRTFEHPDAGVIRKRLAAGGLTQRDLDILERQYRQAAAIRTNKQGTDGMHAKGLALDVVPAASHVAPGATSWGAPVLAWDSLFYPLLGPLGESLGMVWGGRWTSPVDMPHFEMKPGP